MPVQVAIVGGGLGAVAAVQALNGLGVPHYWIYDDEWIGGQLTSQLVPPDEHRWIEQTGRNRSYADLRTRCRSLFATVYPLKHEFGDLDRLNPGGGWVSHLAAPPALWHQLLSELVSRDSKSIVIKGVPRDATRDGDRLSSLEIQTDSGQMTIEADFFIDATETGWLWEVAQQPFLQGVDARSQFHEPNAPTQADPLGLQPITMCAALVYDPTNRALLERHVPKDRFQLPIANPITGDVLDLPFYADRSPRSGDWTWFGYRQVLDPFVLEGIDHRATTLLNQQQTDFVGRCYLEGRSDAHAAMTEASELTLDFVAWLQQHCPRHDGGTGYPEVALAPETAGTVFGLAQRPYVREGRRLIGLETLTERHVSKALQSEPTSKANTLSVGVGCYRIDIHERCSGHPTLDIDSVPFEIPLGCLIASETANALAGGKAISVSHIANGATRTHPTEWSVGEAAGIIAGLCAENRIDLHELFESQRSRESLGAMLHSRGVQQHWPPLPLV